MSADGTHLRRLRKQSEESEEREDDTARVADDATRNADDAASVVSAASAASAASAGSGVAEVAEAEEEDDLREFVVSEDEDAEDGGTAGAPSGALAASATETGSKVHLVHTMAWDCVHLLTAADGAAPDGRRARPRIARQSVRALFSLPRRICWLPLALDAQFSRLYLALPLFVVLRRCCASSLLPFLSPLPCASEMRGAAEVIEMFGGEEEIEAWTGIAGETEEEKVSLSLPHPFLRLFASLIGLVRSSRASVLLALSSPMLTHLFPSASSSTYSPVSYFHLPHACLFYRSSPSRRDGHRIALRLQRRPCASC